MCGALMATGAEQQHRARQETEGEKCKEKPQQGVMKVNGHAQNPPFHEQHNSFSSMKASGEIHHTLPRRGAADARQRGEVGSPLHHRFELQKKADADAV